MTSLFLELTPLFLKKKGKKPEKKRVFGKMNRKKEKNGYRTQSTYSTERPLPNHAIKL